GSSPSNSGIFFTGAQDNGVNRNKLNSWQHVMIGDGMESVVSHEDPDIVYGAIQNGAISRSTDGGANFYESIAPTDNGSWCTPFIMDRHNANILYFGAKHLWKTEDGGSQWTDITPTGVTGGEITSLVQAPSDEKVIYFAQTTASTASNLRIRKTIDGGKTWILINKGLPTSNLYLSGIAVDPLDAQHIWISVSGYSAANKVFESTDGGGTWTNITQNLPNVPANCIVAEPTMEKGVYVGTDLGVFYKSTSTGGWVLWNDGLPVVMVNELEVLPQFGKIRAATYGRGVWEAPIAGSIVGIEKIELFNNDIKLYPNPASSQAYISTPKELSLTDI
ncbi:MAG TPA: hypothetical protein VM187_00810, partial [Niastella sp.]|nr:hypothetical protein [Niastella sp.]